MRPDQIIVDEPSKKGLFIRKLIGKVWGIYCPRCGEKMIPTGFYGMEKCLDCEREGVKDK